MPEDVEPEAFPPCSMEANYGRTPAPVEGRRGEGHLRNIASDALPPLST